MFPPKTCVVGAKGFVGKALINAYRAHYPDAIGTDYRDDSSLSKVDLAENPSINNLDLSHYSYAIIAAAYPNLLLCEKNPQYAYQINVKGTLELVRQFIDRKITPILFSTDYVFDGQTGAYDESAAVKPLNAYGRQKAELERFLLQNYQDRYLLIRLSKVYGLQKGDGTLIDQMIQSFLSGIPVRAAYDQIFSPVAINDVVSAIIRLQNANARGVYHVCGPGSLSRLDVARCVCKLMKANEALVVPISLDDLHEPFARPKRTDMISRKIIDIPMRSLNSSVQYLAEQYLERN